MALSFQWDEIAFRRVTAGWPNSARCIYRDIIAMLHLNDAVLSDAQLRRGWREYDWDPKTWKRHVQFLVEQGKLQQDTNGYWTNGRVSRDHARITGRNSAPNGQDSAPDGQLSANPRKNPDDNSTISTASAPPLQVTGIQGTGIQDTGNKNARAREDFEAWYDLYPLKKERKAAEKAYLKARKEVSQETLLAGLQNYIDTKPPDINWKYPATWLNKGCWDDGPSIPIAAPKSRDPMAAQLDAIYEGLKDGPGFEGDGREHDGRSDPAGSELHRGAFDGSGDSMYPSDTEQPRLGFGGASAGRDSEDFFH